MTAAKDRATMNGKPVFTVPAKAVLNLESGFAHKLLCDGPTFSTGSACVYRCVYCYVPAIMGKSPHLKEVRDSGLDHEDVVIRRSGAVEALRLQLVDRTGRPKYKTPGDTRVIYSSPLVDVAANMDLISETIDCCRAILELTNWQIRLLSKSNLLPKVAEGLAAHEEIRTAARRRVIYGVSTGTLDDSLAAVIEQGTPKVSKRIQSLHWLQQNEFRTFGMICPSLPMPPKAYRDWSREINAAIRADRCEHVWAEVINARGHSMTRTIKALRDGGFDREASLLDATRQDKTAWESYARETFHAHVRAVPAGKLRFLQYVTADSRDWWKAHEKVGAIVL